MTWQGIVPVLPTPFTESGDLALDGYASNIDRLITSGVNGLIALATAGEAPSMNRTECLDVVTARRAGGAPSDTESQAIDAVLAQIKAFA